MNKYEIVKRLEYCAENKCDICQEENGSGFPWIDGRCYGFTERLYDALALLKAQEARMMTLKEVKKLDSDYYYLESMRSPGKELREIVGAYVLTCVTWPSITWARQTMGDSGYGKTWRCWTSRPTDEQREATPWN